MLGLDDLPAALRRYLLGVIVAGPVAAIAVAIGGAPRLSTWDLLVACLLTALAALADRFRFHLSYMTNFDVTAAAYVAMILTLPPALPGLLAILSFVSGEALRRRGQRLDAGEFLFNVGQTALAVTAGALAYAAARPLASSGPAWAADVGVLLAVAIGATALQVVNTGLVAVAAALHLGTRPLRVWWHGLGVDLPAHGTLTALGGVAALLASDHPVALPLLAVPAVLVHRALRDTVRLRADTHAALAALAEVVELRDPYTAGHSRRVAETARALALRLRLTHEEADLIASAGRVHDIGKVALDPSVLTKPGQLDAAEWAEMRRHPGLGADVVARFAAYGDGHRLVRHHHEAWDGSGYPDGLAGEAIPLGARILAVADTFDALTSARPYRAAVSSERALQILAAGAGAQWDPDVVASLIAHLGVASPAFQAPEAGRQAVAPI